MGRVGKQPDRLKKVVDQNRLRNVELERACGAGRRHGGVVADDLEAGLDATSPIVGLRLPGMIDDVSPSSGMISSPSPQRGPEPRRRMSLAIFTSETASTFSVPRDFDKGVVGAHALELARIGREGEA